MIDPQKKAQRKYDKKCKAITIKYSPADMEQFDRLETYLAKTGRSRNAFIKSLIGDFLNNYDKINSNNIEEREAAFIEWKLNRTEEYPKYGNMNQEDLRFLMENFPAHMRNSILREYTKNIRDSVLKIFADKNIKYRKWILKIYNRLDDEQFTAKKFDEVLAEIKKDMSENI